MNDASYSRLDLARTVVDTYSRKGGVEKAARLKTPWTAPTLPASRHTSNHNIHGHSVWCGLFLAVLFPSVRVSRGFGFVDVPTIETVTTKQPDNTQIRP